MHVLVAVTDYPDNVGKVALMYVHTRNLYYMSQGIDVTVLNFRANSDYIVDDIKVIGVETFNMSNEKYDILILHAANIRNHYIFLKRNGNKFNSFIFFYHGHEVLRCNKVYSKPYSYVRRSKVKNYFQDLYDIFKLAVWRNYLPKVKNKSYFVFVSKWMKDEFIKWTRLTPEILYGRSMITYNCVGEEFEKSEFQPHTRKRYDFVTVRGNLDGSKYSIDIVNQLAKNTPDKKFLVVGKGQFFQYYDKAANIEWMNTALNHKQIIEVLQKSKFALMPTRTDAQGLMMCEMAALGMPLITSDIPVCHEIFSDFKNVYYIDNDNSKLSLSEFQNDKCVCSKHKAYYKKNTVSKEIELLESISNL